MRTYSIGAFLKTLLGITILVVLFNYVNVYEHTSLGLGFGFLGVFLLVWGASYFFFRALWSVFSSYEEHIMSSASYKMSLMLGVYTIINLTFMIIGKWSNMVGIGLIVLFVLLQYLITSDFRKQHNT